MNRARRLQKQLSRNAEVSVRGSIRIVSLLMHDDSLMAELMAVCARKGPADNDSDFEFVGEVPNERYIKNIWLCGGSGLPATHHLPEPADPTQEPENA